MWKRFLLHGEMREYLYSSKFPPSFVTVHDTTICRMMLVLLPVLLFGSQVGEVVGLPPKYEDIGMTLQFAG